MNRKTLNIVFSLGTLLFLTGIITVFLNTWVSAVVMAVGLTVAFGSLYWFVRTPQES